MRIAHFGVLHAQLRRMETTSIGARVPVLVVGAGPVGLIAAIRLREQGVAVRVIDEQTAEAKRTYPVLLHPRTLHILASLGVTAPLEWRGRFIKHVAVYADDLRRVVLDLPSAEQIAPGAVTLPQDVLRQGLMNRLSSLGTEVEWKKRLVALEQSEGLVRVGLVRRERVEGEAPKLKPEWLDVASETVEAEFVVGADGIRSAVRKTLGIEMVDRGPREAYVFYDVPDGRAGDEAHLILAAGYASTVYPLQANLSRFSFQVAVRTSEAPGLTELRELLASRMPWYAASPTNFEWSGAAEFHPALASSFGERRVWLAGDAAHSVGPLGAQSVNVGMHEADDLARRISHSLADGPVPLASGYAEQRRIEWYRLFGLGSSAPSLARAPTWVSQNIAQLLPTLPVSGDELDDVLEQLRVRTA
jgi:2-polyprenyl-6-methoxyphenol hydroxylase-like FAD-dependent oxidoreductase